MDFGEALKALKEGKKVARAEWNNKFLVIKEFNYMKFIAINTKDSKFTAWIVNQADLLAEDYYII